MKNTTRTRSHYTRSNIKKGGCGCSKGLFGGKDGMKNTARKMGGKKRTHKKKRRLYFKIFKIIKIKKN